MSSSGGGTKAEIGVLFVHGIGQPLQKNTLRSFAEPLCLWIEGRLATMRPAGRVLPELFVLEHPLPHDGMTPAHADLEIPAEDGSRARWLLAESWWARDIGTPTFSELITWGWRAIPWTIGSHCAQRVARAVVALKEGRFIDGLMRAFLLLYEVGVFAAMSVLALGLVLASTALGAVALLPVPVIRRLLRRIQDRIASTIGDSYALVSHRLGGRSAILGRLAHDVQWLADRCDTVVVVAHSQGAAAAHLTFRTRQPPPVTLLLTFGSGIRKLEELLRSKHTTVVSTLPMLVCTLLLLLAFHAQLATSLFHGVAAAPFAIGLVLVAFIIFAVSRFLNEELEEELKAELLPLRRHLEWKDCYSSHDPVPNGPLFAEEELVSTAVANRASWWSDHTAYWRNRDEFVGMVASEILRLRPSTEFLALSTDHRQKLAAQRARRVRCLATARLTTLLSSALVAFMAWPVVAAFVLPHVAPVRTALRLSAAEAYVGWAITAVVLFVLLPWSSYGVSALGWALWDGHDTRTSVRHDAYNGRPAGRLCFSLLTAAVLAMHIAIVIALSHLSSGQAALALTAGLVLLAGAVFALEWRHRTWLSRRQRLDENIPEFVLPVKPR